MSTSAASVLHAPPHAMDIEQSPTHSDIEDIDINPPVHYIIHDTLHDSDTSLMRSNSLEIWLEAGAPN